MTVGNRTYQYDPATYFVMSMALPAIGKVHADDKTGAPYLDVSLTPEPGIIADLLANMPDSGTAPLHGAGFAVAPVTAELLDAWIRLLRLMNKPDDITALSPVQY